MNGFSDDMLPAFLNKKNSQYIQKKTDAGLYIRHLYKIRKSYL